MATLQIPGGEPGSGPGSPWRRKTVNEVTRASIIAPRASVAATLETPAVGDAVVVGTQQLRGTLRFFGEASFSTGEWMGVALDEPYGKNDGSIKGERYFECKPNHGLFVRPTMVLKAPGSPDLAAAPAKTTPDPPKPDRTPTAVTPPTKPDRPVRQSVTAHDISRRRPPGEVSPSSESKAAPASPTTSESKARPAAWYDSDFNKSNKKALSVVPEALPQDHKQAAAARGRLVSAIEDRDVHALEAALPVASRLGVDDKEIALAQHVLNFEVLESTWKQIDGVRLAVIKLSNAVHHATSNEEPPKEWFDRLGQRLEERVLQRLAPFENVGQRLMERVWQGLEARLEQAVKSAVAAAGKTSAIEPSLPSVSPSSTREPRIQTEEATPPSSTASSPSFTAESPQASSSSMGRRASLGGGRRRASFSSGQRFAPLVNVIEIPENLGFVADVVLKVPVEKQDSGLATPPGSPPPTADSPHGSSGSAGRRASSANRARLQACRKQGSRYSLSATCTTLDNLGIDSILLEAENAKKEMDEMTRLCVRLALEGAAARCDSACAIMQAAMRGRNTRRQLSRQKESVTKLQVAVRQWQARRARTESATKLALAVEIASKRHRAWMKAFVEASQGDGLICDVQAFEAAFHKVHRGLARRQVRALWNGFVNGSRRDRMDGAVFCQMAAAVTEGPRGCAEIADMSVHEWARLGEEDAVEDEVSGRAGWSLSEIEASRNRMEAAMQRVEEKACDTLQASMRGHIARKQFRLQKESVKKLQAAMRQWHLRSGTTSPWRRLSLAVGMVLERRRAWMDIFEEACQRQGAGSIGAQDFEGALLKAHRHVAQPQARALWKGFTNGEKRETIDGAAFCRLAITVTEGPEQCAHIAQMSMSEWNRLGEEDARAANGKDNFLG